MLENKLEDDVVNLRMGLVKKEHKKTEGLTGANSLSLGTNKKRN